MAVNEVDERRTKSYLDRLFASTAPRCRFQSLNLKRPLGKSSALRWMLKPRKRVEGSRAALTQPPLWVGETA